MGERVADFGEEEKATQLALVLKRMVCHVGELHQQRLTNPGDMLVDLNTLTYRYHGRQEHPIGTHVADLQTGTQLEGMLRHTSTRGPLDGDKYSTFSQRAGHPGA